MAEQTYTGWVKWIPTPEEWGLFEVEHKVPFEMLENQYLMIYDESEPTKLCSQYVYKGGQLYKVSRSSIKVAKEKEMITADGEKKIKTYKSKARSEDTTLYPRNDEQICAFDLMKDTDTTIKLLTGTWGTGKTMLLVASALEQLRAGNFEQIIWIRNDVDLKDTKPMGALPGDVIEKFLPYLGPFIDHAGRETVECMLNNGHLAIEPLQSLRGRNFKNSIIICSEAENLTYDQLKLIVARVADGSALYIDGDVRQRDRASFERSQGLEKFIECLKGEPLFGYVKLLKSERSATAKLADKLDNF